MPRASVLPTGSIVGNQASPSSDSRVVNSQSSTNTSCSCATTGPSS